MSRAQMAALFRRACAMRPEGIVSTGEDLRRMQFSERRKRLVDLLGGDDALWL